MAKIAFLMMVHKDPDRVVRHARALTMHGDAVAIHVDARVADAAHRAIAEGIAGNPLIVLCDRVRCGWGEWSLAQATLNLIHAARHAFEGTTHYYLISGDCMPTKTRGYIDAYLDAGTDIIEAHDFLTSDWIKVGIKEERLTYRHWFNERKNKAWFYRSLDWQRRLGLSRRTPKDLTIRIGSQWWCLRAGTVEKILDLLARRRDVIRFFRTTWIPDETFFQTLVGHVVPEDEIRCQPPTTLLFSDYGMPVVFQNDHADFLCAQDHLFARKISPRAHGLQERLLETFAQTEAQPNEGGGSPGLYAYLAGRGRIGERYAQRFWETAIARRTDAEIMVIAARPAALGHALQDAIHTITALPSIGYAFDSQGEVPIALGNLERGMEKRDQHRHALMNLVFGQVESERVVVLADPANLGLIDDLDGMVDQLRVLYLDRRLDDDALLASARARNLIGDNAGPFDVAQVLKSLRRETREHGERLAERYRGRFYRNRLDRPRSQNISDLREFLCVSHGEAEAVAREAEKLQARQE